VDPDRISLFALEGSRGFGQVAAEALGLSLARHEERAFEDGEHKARPLEAVRGKDVYVVHGLYGDHEQTANDKLVRLLFFVGALKDAAADRVTAVVPYLAYARKDRQTKPRDPVTTRYVGTLFEAAGVDAVVTMDVHNLAAYQNAFRCRSEHLEARKPFVERLLPLLGDRPAAVVSPDAGGVKRAERFRQGLSAALGDDVGSAFMEKQRSEGVLSGRAVVGDLEGRTAIIVDDLIASGGTLARGARACMERGAVDVIAAATHGLFVGDADRVLADPNLSRVMITDTVPPFRLRSGAARDKLYIVPVAPVFAEAIRRMHQNGSIVELVEM